MDPKKNPRRESEKAPGVCRGLGYGTPIQPQLYHIANKLEFMHALFALFLLTLKPQNIIIGNRKRTPPREQKHHEAGGSFRA